MAKPAHACVAHDELVTLPGYKPGTAIRLCLQNGQDATIRLEQLAHSDGLGWYVQKTFSIPADMLSTLIPELRKADCLIPRTPKSMRLYTGPDLPSSLPITGQRRRA